MDWIRDLDLRCRSVAIDAIEVVACMERWRAVSDDDKHLVVTIVDIDTDSLLSICRRQERMLNERTLSVTTSSLDQPGDDSGMLDDDIAMLLRFGVHLAERSPIVSFWAFATLMSLGCPAFHEAKNYWLSASAAVMRMARTRSPFVQCGYMHLILSAYDPGCKACDVLLLPLAEMRLECDVMLKQSIAPSDTDLASTMTEVLADALHYAVEDDARAIAAGAFPLLYPSQ